MIPICSFDLQFQKRRYRQFILVIRSMFSFRLLLCLILLAFAQARTTTTSNFIRGERIVPASRTNNDQKKASSNNNANNNNNNGRIVDILEYQAAKMVTGSQPTRKKRQ